MHYLWQADIEEQKTTCRSVDPGLFVSVCQAEAEESVSAEKEEEGTVGIRL
jgi:hypothetical protein